MLKLIKLFELHGGIKQALKLVAYDRKHMMASLGLTDSELASLRNAKTLARDYNQFVRGQ